MNLIEPAGRQFQHLWKQLQEEQREMGENSKSFFGFIHLGKPRQIVLLTIKREHFPRAPKLEYE